MVNLSRTFSLRLFLLGLLEDKSLSKIITENNRGSEASSSNPTRNVVYVSNVNTNFRTSSKNSYFKTNIPYRHYLKKINPVDLIAFYVL